MDGSQVLTSFGALGVLLVIFAESGLLVVGFFLPGDTLLFPAGLLCAGGRPGPHLSLWQVLVCGAVGSIAGAQFGFLIGRRGGAALLARSDNRHLEKAVARVEEMLSRYGYGKAIALGRFVPMLRTVLSPAAGALGVPVRTFTIWQTVGALAWSQSLVLAGYALGTSVPHIDHYLLPLVAFIVVVSLLPLLVEIRRARRQRQQGQGEDQEHEGERGRSGSTRDDRAPQRRD
ncbi:DedA family protein [Streptomyces polygonati]|uniref:DedA family protein n=1 Tax=Streptomyces polygonati TaxID=1617087 RepID=A0ABV8HL85_9ACTN